MSHNWDKIIRCRTGIKTACGVLKGSMLRLVILLVLSFPFRAGYAQEPKQSDETEGCLSCHASVTPGIVADWENSHHARVAPTEALQKEKLTRRVSADSLPEHLAMIPVGCAECHTMNPEKHNDTFGHNGYQILPVLSWDRGHGARHDHPGDIAG